jgi:hypothetical protein
MRHDNRARLWIEVMIWILLAAIGVPLWLVAGGLLGMLWSRRQLRRQPGVFVCRLRPAGQADKSAWPRAKRYAYWVHDVLLVHRGAALMRYEALPVSSVAGPVAASTVKGLGDRAMSLQLHLDDGRLFDLAARNQDVAPATGPFVTASMR